MKASELHDKTPDQLRDALVNLKKEAFNLRFQQATGQLENPARLRNVKRDVARVKTVLTQKAAGAASDGTSAGKSSDGTSAGKSSDGMSADKTKTEA